MTKSLTEQKIRKIIENVTGKAAKVCEQKFYDKPKSLTEQWREGTLPCGAYYVNRLGDVRIYLVTYENQKNTHEIYEVLAPVQSYEEVKHWDECANKIMDEVEKLQEQLKEANAIIEDMRPFIQGSMKRETFMRILRYEDKWGVK